MGTSAALALGLAVTLSDAGPLVSGSNLESAAPPLPLHLRDTGIYVAGSTTEIHPDNLAYSPQYPLWSDGAKKRRWLHVPAGRAIDASHPDAWEFPPGTRLWKEFSHGRPVETRYIERLADGTWRFATYVWNEAGTDAILAPAEGVAALAVSTAPSGRYAIPARDDCLACHEGAAVPVLGVSALQLSPDRDPLAPHAEPVTAEQVDLRDLAARGWLRNLPAAYLSDPPRVAADTPTARAALGYLHGNCGHCHNEVGSLASLGLSLAQNGRADASHSVTTLLAQTTRFRSHGLDRRIVPGRSDTSVLAVRMRSRDPLKQMPPIGTQILDAEAYALIARWIDQELPSQQESMP